MMEINKNSDYTTENLLDYEYFSKHYKLTATDVTKQKKLENLNTKQQTDFIGNLERDGEQ